MEELGFTDNRDESILVLYKIVLVLALLIILWKIMKHSKSTFAKKVQKIQDFEEKLKDLILAKTEDPSTIFLENCSFESTDTTNWLQHLQYHGVVVVKNVLTPNEVQHARSKYWDKIESVSPMIKRD